MQTLVMRMKMSIPKKRNGKKEKEGEFNFEIKNY